MVTGRAASRRERIARAEQIVLADPNVSKRVLQTQLRSEYGIGLSDTARRQVLQRANTPGVLRARVSTPAFTRNERIVLRRIIRRTGSTPYLARAINERFTSARAARDAGDTRRDFMRRARDEAKDRGYIATRTTRTKKTPDGTVRGQVDWWKLLRDYRDKDIDRGDYVPKIRPKPKTDKGDLAAQKARYQDRQSTKAHARWVEKERSRLQTWIAQKDRAIDVSTGARRRQLEQERNNLERSLRSLR